MTRLHHTSNLYGWSPHRVSDQRNYKRHQEDEKQYLCNSRKCYYKSEKPKNTGQNHQNKKCHYQSEHFLVSISSSIVWKSVSSLNSFKLRYSLPARIQAGSRNVPYIRIFNGLLIIGRRDIRKNGELNNEESSSCRWFDCSTRWLRRLSQNRQTSWKSYSYSLVDSSPHNPLNWEH